MNWKNIFLSAAAGIFWILPQTLTAGETIVFQDDFKDPEYFKKVWRNYSAEGKSSYETGEKGLTVTTRNNPFHDGYIECDIPLIKRGMLEFDMEYPDPSLATGIGLFVDLYNISTFFHGSIREWRAYFPEPESKKLEGYPIEPVGHRKITNVNPKAKSHYRILFDMAKDRVEFYKDDMSDPAYIQGNISVFGHSFYRGGKLRIGSMGYAKTPYQARISNLKLTALEDTSSGTVPRKEILLFQGFTFDELNIFNALTTNGTDKKEITRYTLNSISSSTIIINRLQYDKLPGENRLKQAKMIVLADAPAGPGNIIPDFILSDIADSVKEGARLVIFGGFFTLEKGEYQKSSLEPVLPVILEKPDTTLKFAEPRPVRSNAKEFQWIDQTEKPFQVRLLHDLKLKPGAAVKMTVDQNPVLVEWKIGKGSVAIFLGKKAGRGFLYTDHPEWHKLANQICRGEQQ